MATLQYLTLWFAAFVGAGLMGCLTHYLHAHFKPYPDKLIDGHSAADHALNALLSKDYVIWGEYDEGGWWAFSSVRNLALHTLPPLFLVLVVGLALWEQRDRVVHSVCANAAAVGLSPRICR